MHAYPALWSAHRTVKVQLSSLVAPLLRIVHGSVAVSDSFTSSLVTQSSL